LNYGAGIKKSAVWKKKKTLQSTLLPVGPGPSSGGGQEQGQSTGTEGRPYDLRFWMKGRIRTGLGKKEDSVCQEGRTKKALDSLYEDIRKRGARAENHNEELGGARAMREKENK